MSIAPKHKKEPILRSFSSPEEMAEHATKAYRIGIKKVNQLELDNGFDVHDVNSVINFDIPYTPLGNRVLIKEIPKPDPDKEGTEIQIIDLSKDGKKFWVVAVGTYVNDLKKGDIISLRVFETDIRVPRRSFNKVAFQEFGYNDIAGVYDYRETIMARYYNAKIEDLNNLNEEGKREINEGILDNNIDILNQNTNSIRLDVPVTTTKL